MAMPIKIECIRGVHTIENLIIITTAPNYLNYLQSLLIIMDINTNWDKLIIMSRAAY